MTATRRPILFSCTESAALFHPHLLIAAELAARGIDDLHFATDDNRRADVEAASGKSDVRFVPMGAADPRELVAGYDDATYRAATQPDPWKAYLTRVKQSLDVEGHFARIRRLSEAVDRIQPSLLVINGLTMHAVHLAVTRNLPYVLVVPGVPSDLMKATLPADYPAPGSGLPLRMDTRQQRANRRFRLHKRTMFLDGAVLRHSMAFEKARKTYGIESKILSSAAIMGQAELILGFSLFGLEYPFDAPDKLRMLGPAVPPASEPPAELTAWLDAHPSVVYVAFGSGTRLTDAEISAVTDTARRLGDHAVLWKLPPQQRAALGALPANLLVVDEVPARQEVLGHPHVRAFVHHGGTNSFHHAIAAGVPQVIRPTWLDGRDLAVRAVDSGVGLTVSGLTAGQLHAAVLRVLTEPSFTERSAHFGHLGRVAGGVPAAADLILDSEALR